MYLPLAVLPFLPRTLNLEQGVQRGRDSLKFLVNFKQRWPQEQGQKYTEEEASRGHGASRGFHTGLSLVVPVVCAAVASFSPSCQLSFSLSDPGSPALLLIL